MWSAPHRDTMCDSLSGWINCSGTLVHPGYSD